MQELQTLKGLTNYQWALKAHLDHPAAFDTLDELHNYVNYFIEHDLEHNFTPLLSEIAMLHIMDATLFSSVPRLTDMKNALIDSNKAEQIERDFVAFMYEFKMGLPEAIETYWETVPYRTYVHNSIPVTLPIVSHALEQYERDNLLQDRDYTYYTGSIDRHFSDYISSAAVRAKAIQEIITVFEQDNYQGWRAVDLDVMRRMAHVKIGEREGISLENIYASAKRVTTYMGSLTRYHETDDDELCISYDDIESFRLDTSGSANEPAIRLKNYGEKGVIVKKGTGGSAPDFKVVPCKGVDEPGVLEITERDSSGNLTFEMLEIPVGQNQPQLNLTRGQQWQQDVEGYFSGKFISGHGFNVLDPEVVSASFTGTSLTLNALKPGRTTVTLYASNVSGSGSAELPIRVK